jgi:hypothetical protein
MSGSNLAFPTSPKMKARAKGWKLDPMLQALLTPDPSQVLMRTVKETLTLKPTTFKKAGMFSYGEFWWTVYRLFAFGLFAFLITYFLKYMIPRITVTLKNVFD